MRIVFDQGTPLPLRRHLAGHTVTTASEAGWATLTNGALLEAAERAGFAVLDAITPGSYHEIAIWLKPSP
jgi:hypothetical protein